MRISSSPIAVSKRSTKKSRRLHGPGAARAGDDELRPQGQGRCSEVAGRVGVRQRAAEGAAVPDLGVGQLGLAPWPAAPRARRPAGRTGPRSAWSSHRSRSRRRRRGCRGASRSCPRSMTISGALSRIRRTGSRLWPPAMILASSPCSRERAQRLLDRGRCDVVERGGDHAPAPSVLLVPGVSWLPAASWSPKCGIAAPSVVATRGRRRWIAFHTRSGVHGIRTSLTPEVPDGVDDRVDHRRGGRDRARPRRHPWCRACWSATATWCGRCRS